MADPIDILRDALFGNPPRPGMEPSREGVLAAFSSLSGALTYAMAAFVADKATVAYASRSSLYADLTPADGTLGIVYNDGPNNGLFVKSGSTGSGFWQATGLMLQGQQGEMGEQGPDGKSFYQVALDTGYVPAGTTQQQFISAVAGVIAAQATVAAQTARDQASAFAMSSSAAATAAAGFVGGIMYPDTAAGLAATTEGQYFTVAGDGTNTYALLYRKVSGAAALQASYVSKQALDNVLEIASDSTRLKFGGQTIAYITADGILLGGQPGSGNHSKYVITTKPTEDLNGLDVYFYSNQTDPDNQRVGRVLHMYADADGDTIDIVGSKTGQKVRQAWNPVARSDKGPYYVGTGPFVQYLRTRPNGGGTYPDGNLGGKTDRLAWISPVGTFTTFGSDAKEWDGGVSGMPFKAASYEFFENKCGGFGFRPSTGLEIISIDLTAGAFAPIILKGSAWNPPGNLTTTVGGLGSLLLSIGAQQYQFGDGTQIIIGGVGNPEGNISASPGSIYVRRDGGAGATFYVKRTGTGNVGWDALS